MKVIFDHQIFSLQKTGGISRYFVELATELEKLGVDVQIRVRWSENKYLPKKHHLPYFLPWRVRQLSYFLFNYLEDLIFPPQQFDILHTSYFGKSSLKNKAKKHVITIFDMIHELQLAPSSKIDTTVKSKKQALLSADAIIAISNATKLELFQFYPTFALSVQVIYLGSSLQKKVVPPRNGIHEKSKYLLFVGNRSGYKNFLPMLQAIAPLMISGNVRLVCFGGGKFSTSESYSIEALAVKSLIYQVSGSDFELSWYYQHALALIYPSLSEGFGLPIVEAFSLRCPVITSNCSSMKEIGGDCAMFFDPKSQSDIFSAASIVIKDEFLRETLIQKGVSRSKDFSWKLTAKQTLKIYQKALSRQSV